MTGADMVPEANRAAQTLTRRFVLASVSVACIVFASARVAGAQEGGAAAPATAEARATAEAAFQEGRALMASGDFTAACPKLEASLALNPALGARLNLARCYQHTDRPASAWMHYREVAERDGQTRRAEFARAAAAALEPHLPRLVVQTPAAASIPGLVIMRDGAPMEARLFDTAIYVDPGEHELRATAPGYQPFAVRVRVGMDEQIAVVVPPLQPESPPAEPADAGPLEPPGSRAGEPGEDQPPAVDRPAAGAPSVSRVRGGPGARRTVAWATGGAGVVMLASGLGFGLAARAAWDDAREIGLCDPETLMCEDLRGPAMVETARSRARVSGVAAGAGAALLVTGAVFYWMSRDTAGDEHSTRVLPTAGPAGVGLAISGEF
jgi:hypothetical protein